MRLSRLLFLLPSLLLLALTLSGFFSSTHTFANTFPAGTCVDVSVAGENQSWQGKDCAEPHQYVVTDVLVHTTGLVDEQHESCPAGDRAIEVAEVPYGAVVCLRSAS